MQGRQAYDTNAIIPLECYIVKWISNQVRDNSLVGMEWRKHKTAKQSQISAGRNERDIDGFPS
jgi:hypothetical protein